MGEFPLDLMILAAVANNVLLLVRDVERLVIYSSFLVKCRQAIPALLIIHAESLRIVLFMVCFYQQRGQT